MIESNNIYINESANNKRLDDDLISAIDWKKAPLLFKNRVNSSQYTDRTNAFGINAKLKEQMKQVGRNIHGGANDFVTLQPRSNQLTWKLANKRWKDDLDNPIYNQLQHMGIIEIMDYVHQKQAT